MSTMSCDACRRILESDDEAPSPELLEHLEACAACRRLRDEFARLDALCAGLPFSPPSETRRLEILEAVRRALVEEDPSSLTHDVLTLEEVAAFLRIPVDELAHALPGMPTFEIAGHVRIRRERLLAWIEERERHARSHRLLSIVSRS